MPELGKRLARLVLSSYSRARHMLGLTARFSLAALLLAFGGAFSFAQEESGNGDMEVVISVADQRLVVLRDGMWVEKYKVSTSKFGVGDSYGSYKTPVGRHRICDKIGEGLPLGSVIKHRNATGEVLPANAPGRDPIVTRILWLEGLEQKNANARSRGIYIHGTVEEDKLGSPVSYGCIRMRSRDVIDLFENLPLGTVVNIQQEKLPHYKKWYAPPTVILASRSQPKEVIKPAPEKAPEAEKPAAPEKPEVKLVAAKSTEKTPAKALAHSETEPKVVKASAESKEPRVTMGGAAALSALKGSILFSGIPGHGPNVKGLTTSANAKTTPDPEAETAAAAEQLPRVSFRAPIGERLLR